SPLYPRLLAEIDYPPPILFVRGEAEVLQTMQMAVIGSRNPTPLGLELSHQFSHHLVQAGFTITSGLALGIDAAAHQGALAAHGKTIGILGCGVDHIYPPRNQKLAEKIEGQGALVSEFPLGVLPVAKHFPRRNRLVSGLSLGVLVVEAGLKSGSLITA